VIILAEQLGWHHTLLWVGVALVGIIGSAMFSGLETGVYRLNRIRLHLLSQRPGSRAATLAHLVRQPNRLLGTLLIGNNIVNYMASYGIAVLLAGHGFSDWQQVLFNAAMLTPLLFVFGEVLPKDLFANYTDRLTYMFAGFLRVVQILLTLSLMLPLIDLVSRLLSRVLHTGQLNVQTFHPRRAMTELMKESIGHGVLSEYQSDIIDRVLHPTERIVSDAMIDWPQVVTVRAGQPGEAIWALADRVPFSRVPMIGPNGQPIGVLHVHDVLLHPPDECPPIESLAFQVPQVSPQTPLRQALRTLQQNRSAMALVMDGNQPRGIVTLKDLIEPITGELQVW
jgi:putative hemolysin